MSTTQLSRLSPDKQAEVLAMAQEGKQGFLDGFKYNGASLLVSMVETQK